ncbi:MAG: hypothetical protein ACSHXA_15670 [Polaribacter sp.]|jgi:hypothetical protein|uniref:hypothetical protein n=1 Tax=Polaribacter sp. TaxID=1920175 RepID=UPI003EF75DF0
MIKYLKETKLFGEIARFRLDNPSKKVLLLKYKKISFFLFPMFSIFNLLNRPIHAIEHEIAIGQEFAIKNISSV